MVWQDLVGVDSEAIPGVVVGGAARATPIAAAVVLFCSGFAFFWSVVVSGVDESGGEMVVSVVR